MNMTMTNEEGYEYLKMMFDQHPNRIRNLCSMLMSGAVIEYKEPDTIGAPQLSKMLYNSLFQLHMTMEDVRALKLAVLGTSDPANELCNRCNNIIEEVGLYLHEADFKKPKKP